MLSFDITDKTIRIIKGSESHGKIKITDAVTIDIEDNSIENGKISDIPGLASKIVSTLKEKNMKEKKAIVSISSNQTIFKELLIPKAKGKSFLKMVRAEMQAQLGIDDTYSISYIIVDEYTEKTEKNKSEIVKILATACPYEMIDNCKKLFSSISISLKSVMIGCNCISKIILSDIKTCLKMPLLVVQIDRNFLSINLYDDLKLAFSRFTDVDPGDYGFASDYMSQAVNENIFRMLQFQKTRKADSVIENVMFYGELDNIEDIISAAKQMDLNASIIKAPLQVKGCENINFSLYANAIGALFKRNKAIEKVNLLETDINHSGIKSNTSYPVLLAGALALSAAVIGGVWFSFDTKYKSVTDDLEYVERNINNPETKKKKEMFDNLSAQEEKINQYRQNITTAANAFKTHPAISQEYISIIESEMINAANELGLWVQITSFEYDNYTITLSIRTAADSDPSQTLPALIVGKLLNHSEFADVIYNGYNISYNETNNKVVNYEIQIPVAPIELPTELSTESVQSETGSE